LFKVGSDTPPLVAGSIISLDFARQAEGVRPSIVTIFYEDADGGLKGIKPSIATGPDQNGAKLSGGHKISDVENQ